MPPGMLDTPRTNVGDATYLQAQDFDITQEQSFQSPSKDHINILHQMGGGRNGRAGGISLKTPRTRMPFGDRTNNRGAEFTPLLKSATRNSAMMFGGNGGGKENNGMPRTPAFLKPGGLDRVLENDLSPVPSGSLYEEDSNGNSYVDGTPIPRIDSSSIADTPIQPIARRNGGPDVLSDGNQLSLKEQENVIDKIEKENFGLKLKIHFLEEALRKAGPGFSEAALKENTELKVEKVQMQKELHRYRKTASSAEKEIDQYRQQIAHLERQPRGGASDEDLNQLQDALHERESELKSLYQKLDEGDAQLEQGNKLRDAVTDLEHDLREKDRQVDEREDQIEKLRRDINERDDEVVELEEQLKDAKKRAEELNPQQWEDEIDSARETISDLQADIKKLKHELEEAKEDQQQAEREKDQAVYDLQELQDELANKSISTKGLNRQLEDKMTRLEEELEDLQQNHEDLQQNHEVLQQDRQEKIQAIERLQQRITELDQSAGTREKSMRSELESAIRERDDAEKQLQSATAANGNAAQMVAKLQSEVNRLQTSLQAAEQERDMARQQAQSAGNASKLIPQLQGEVNRLQVELDHAIKDRDTAENHNQAIGQQLDEFELSLRNKSDEKELLQIRHDALTSESSSLQKELSRAKESLEDLRHQLDHEKTQSLAAEREVREQYKGEIDRLHDELEDLRAEAREKERAYDDDCQRWEKEARGLEGQRAAAEEQLESLKRTVEKLQAVEGSLSGKETRLQQALELEKQRHAQAETSLSSQISQLNADLQDRQRTLDEVKDELVKLREELRLSQREERSLIEKIEGLEDELDVLQAEASDDRLASESNIRTLEAQADQLGRQIDGYKHELESASSRPTQSFVGHKDTQLKRVEADLERVTRSETRLKEQLLRLESDITALRERAGNAEMERDSIKSTLSALQASTAANGSSSRFAASHSDEEKIELRTQKMRLDLEVRKLQDNLSSLQDQKSTLEAELRVTREAMEDERLTYKEKDLEYLKKDVAHRETVRDLKRQLDELERQAHNLEISLLQTSSPHSSTSSSGRKNEVAEVRAQLAASHATIKDLRTQIKDVEKSSASKLKSLTSEIETKEEEWEADRFSLERSVQSLAQSKSELESKAATAESSISRLKSKILRLEDELKQERESRGEDRTLALERHDLHEMLRDTQIELEQLQISSKSLVSQIENLREEEKELKAQLKRIREERKQERDRADDCMVALEKLEADFQAAEAEWEEEKNGLTRGVRFPNMSISSLRDDERAILQQEMERKEKVHTKEIRGLAMQIEWLRARVKREEGLRSDAAWAKRFMLLQVELFGAWYVCRRVARGSTRDASRGFFLCWNKC